jgi:hypothetical protein
VAQCQTLQVALGWCFAVAVPSTAFLFFLRVKAIFHKRRIIIGIFLSFWLASLATSIMVPFGIQGTHIGTTQYCINFKVKGYAGVASVMNMAHGALVFLAISWRLLSMNDEASRMKAFVQERGFSRLSSAVLTSGQLYYL